MGKQIVFVEQPAVMTHDQAIVASDLVKSYMETEALEFFIGGSFCRHLPTNGDIDIAVQSDSYTRHAVASLVADHGIQTVQAGGISEYYVLRHPQGFAFKIQVWYNKFWSSWGCMQAFVAGDGIFNVRMRQEAIRKGFSLSQYALTRTSDGVIIPTPTERDVFAQLGKQWVEYPKRSYDQSKLQRRPSYE